MDSQLRRGIAIQGQSREIIYNVYRYFLKESNKFKRVLDDDGSKYFNKVQERVVKATGVSRQTLLRILNEVDAQRHTNSISFTTPTKGRPKKGDNKKSKRKKIVADDTKTPIKTESDFFKPIQYVPIKSEKTPQETVQNLEENFDLINVKIEVDETSVGFSKTS